MNIDRLLTFFKLTKDNIPGQKTFRPLTGYVLLWRDPDFASLLIPSAIESITLLPADEDGPETVVINIAHVEDAVSLVSTADFPVAAYHLLVPC